jgi:type IX secretion system PorP/SprF family membrane protein
MKRLLLFVLVWTISINVFAQQEVLNSQYMFNNLLVNPAYAGYKEDINVNLMNRNQWVGVSGAPTTQSLVADGAFFEDNKVGLGLTVLNDKMGLQSQTSVMVNYAYRLPVGYGDSRFSFGLGIGAAQYGLNASAAVVGDNTDINFNSNTQYLVPDARLGVFYNSDSFYFGLSANNLLNQVISQNNSRVKNVILPPIHMFLTVGGIVDVNNFVKFKPSIMLRDNPVNRGNCDFNASFLINDLFWIGGSYRMSVDMWKNTNSNSSLFQTNSLIGLVEVFVAKKIRVGYAYDYSLSQLKNVSSGSHEISLGLIIGNKNNRNYALTTPRYF